MTTRTRDSAPPVKEKRGTSPSPHTGLTQQRTRRSLNPSTTNSPAPTRDPTTTRPEKPVPNYLKTTVSSRLEASSNSKQQGKKPALSTTDTAHNPTLMRRRSFDKPPPRAQISRVSTNPPLRSSSFSGRTVSTQKPVLEKNLRGTKDSAGKQHSLYARPVSTVKKSGVHVKKQEIGSSSTSMTKERVISVTEKVDNLPNNVPEPEKTQPEIREVFVSESEEEKVHVEENDEKGGEDLVVEDQEPVKIEQTDGDTDKDVVETISVELPTVLEEVKQEVVSEDKPHDIEEINTNKDELKENTVSIEQSVATSPNEEVQEKDNKEEEEETGRENEAPKTKETEVEEVEVMEEKKEEKIEVPSKPKVQVAPQAKRDAVSNDVIEETASKLREQRKNKVRALAGAFETVISLQDK